MKILWVITFSICMIDYYLLTRKKVVFGDWQRARLTEEMTWHKILETCILCGVLLIITSNRVGTDIINYYNWYVREQETTREPLYTFLRIKAHQSGMSFYVFRTILSAITGVLPCMICRKYKIPITYFMCLYMPSLLFADSMQFRNAMAIYIMIPATFLLLMGNYGIRNKLFFIICVCIAAQLHTSFYCYFLFLLMTSKRKKTYAKVIFLLGIGLLLVSVLNHRTVPFINTIYRWILSGGDSRTYLYSGGHMIFLYPMIVHLFSTGLLWYYAQFWDGPSDNIEKKYIDFINTINLIFFVFVPLTMMSTTFYRYLRNMYMFDIVSAYFLIRNLKYTKKSDLIFINMFCVSLLWLFFMIGIYSTTEIIINPIFKEGVWFWK